MFYIIAGSILLSLPFLIVSYLAIEDIGWKLTALAWLIVIAVGCIVSLGVFFIAEGLS